MADALVSVVLEQLTSIVGGKLREELKLHKGVKDKDSFSNMAGALVSVVLEQLTSIVVGKLEEELKLHKGVKTKIQKLITDFETITAVLDDAEKRSVKENAVEKWVDRLKDICYDMEDVLDEWRTATILKQQLQRPESASSLKNKVRLWTSSHLPWFNRIIWKRNIAVKINDINQRLDEVVKDKDRYNFKVITGTTPEELERRKTTSFIDVLHTHGRDKVKESLIGRLLSESSQEEHGLTITAIVGMGGMGKTTLAQLVFNDGKKHFQKQIWVCVSHPFNIIHIARAILEGLGIKDRDLTQQESMLQIISKALESQKFFLVLDDVWNEDYKKWEPVRNCLKNGAQGSKILVTTRSKGVADIMEAPNTIRLEKLSTEECWSIFSKIAFFGRSKEKCKVLEEIGWKILERCKGLPPAAIVLGGLMRLKRSRLEWQNVLDSDLWELKEANKELDSVFMLSYYDFPSPMKRCFTYCAIFPEDYIFNTDYLIKLWMANGFLEGKEMEITAEEYFESLAMRSLFQDIRRDDYSGRIVKCKMHDLVREFSLRLSRNECGAIEVYKDEEELPAYEKLRHVRLICEGGHSSTALSKFSINGLRTLVTNLDIPNVKMKVSGDLFCGLTSLRVLELRWLNIKELPVEIVKLMHLRYLALEYNQDLEPLPETVCDLFNLQTLKLKYWFGVKTLPRGIGKLLNLRHLEVDEYMKLPKGIGELTFLQTLSGPEIICSPKNKSSNGSSNNSNIEEEYFGIGDLEKLNYLRGDLRLKLPGNVELDVVVGEAKRAQLKNKKNLRGLFLHFEKSWKWNAAKEEEEERAKRHLLIAEALLEEEPPLPYLEELKFEDYEGTELPSWITCLSGLKSLSLCYCDNLKELPETVCDLFNLQSLKLSFCFKMKRLPRGIGKLLHLRHLECDLDMKLPKGIGELTSIRTLRGLTFSPPKNKSGNGGSNTNNNKEEEEKECLVGIGDLEKLNCLEDLGLYGLGNVELLDDVVGEAKRARLKKKKNLRNLVLGFNELWKWNASKEAEEERAKRHLLITEALLQELPPPYLETLTFMFYRGTELPSRITSFSGLKFFSLSNCPNLKELPGDFFERLPPLLSKVDILHCPTLAEYCRRRMNGNSALASLFRIP